MRLDANGTSGKHKRVFNMGEFAEDKAVLQQKIEQYKDMLYKLAFSQMRSRQDAEDVVQEVFYQYIKSRKQFINGEHEKAWLIRVTLHACRKIWRSAWYKHSVPFLTPQDIPDDGSMDEQILEKERDLAVLKAVMGLPRKYREVIHLFYFEDLSIKEICDATGKKTNTVTSQLTRGRNLLQKTLRKVYCER